MKISEIEIINRYFQSHLSRSPHTILGIGDDAAILEIPADQQLVVTIDTLNEGVHFFSSMDAEDLGYKSLAVSLSDIAAMGATPQNVLLSLSLPLADENWIKAFAKGFFALADQYAVDLVGGDTTRGPLSITTVLNGFIARGKALYRNRAQAGDLIYVTGTLGDAGRALDLLKQQLMPDSAILSRLNRPIPRVEVGLKLREISRCAMDISDGLVLDLTRLCLASGVGAKIYANQLPFSASLQKLSLLESWQYALTAGDDYELLFTLPERYPEKEIAGVKITQIGEIIQGSGVQVLDENSNIIKLKKIGFDHFA